MIIIDKYKHTFLNIFLLFTIFIFSIGLEYSRFLDFKAEEFFSLEAKLINIYKKDNFDIYKFQGKNFDFFTKISHNKIEINEENYKKLDSFYIIISSKNINFLEYLKGFFTTNYYLEKIETKAQNSFLNIENIILDNIRKNHTSSDIIELFDALFLAIPVNVNLREVFTDYSISHLIALSGFHLVVLSFSIYWIIYYFYSYFHQKYFPFRNKKYDIILFSIAVLFYYLLLTNIVPSLLRAFVLFCLGLFLLRSNIKILSYTTLLYTFLIVISLFPKYIFSIGFWFSTMAVFYIYLFMQYFKSMNKWLMLLFFNIWMFLIFNPVVHYFFYQTALEQFYSIPLTIFFTIFYPLEIVAHIFMFANIFDGILDSFLNSKVEIYMIKTPLWLFILYIIYSFFSIFNKRAFVILNILMIGFNLYLFL